MQYIKLSTKEFPFHQGDIRLEHPEIGEEFVCPETYALVEVEEVPSFEENECLIQHGPTLENGKWVVRWEVALLPEEDYQQYLRSKEEHEKLLKSLTTPNKIMLDEMPGEKPNVIG